MKKTRKLLALVMAFVMVMAMAAPAMATDITITGGAAGSEYAAYKLLDATDGGDGKFAYTLNEEYTSILQNITGKTERADIVAYISALDAEGIRTFADDVYADITAGGIDADYTTNDNSFNDVAQGYYLIAETKVGDTADTFSLVMLDTAGEENIEVKTKEDKPTVEKKVKDTNDTTNETSGWKDSADHDFNDIIDYQITGTVSSKYADYLSYYYSFSDTMVKGLTYNDDAKVFVVNGDTETDVTEQFTISLVGTEGEDNHGFTATANLKELTGVTIDAGTKIVVRYTCTLNANAVSGAPGNKNEVVLKYENDPYHKADGKPETPDTPEKPGETPKDVNIVFTYNVIVNKIDKDKNLLEGAGFTLYKGKLVTAATESTEAIYEWVAVGDEVVGEALTTFTFNKLDDGYYKLVETTTPAGYNTAEDLYFTIEATHDEETADPKLLTLVVEDKDGTVVSDGDDAIFKIDMETGNIVTDVINNTGAELPETGGIGTTIFYAVGGILVLAAIVLLVTKKRMASEE